MVDGTRPKRRMRETENGLAKVAPAGMHKSRRPNSDSPSENFVFIYGMSTDQVPSMIPAATKTSPVAQMGLLLKNGLKCVNISCEDRILEHQYFARHLPGFLFPILIFPSLLQNFHLSTL